MSSNVILVVDDIQIREEHRQHMPENQMLIFKDFLSLTAETLLIHRPKLILAPLTTPGFDAMDLAARLQQFLFSGAFRVFTPRLPDMAMVESELKALAPDVDCQLIELANADRSRLF